MAEQRLQKWLANAGHGSRRQLEALIKEGRIKVNGEVAELGCKVVGDERISIDGRFIRTVNAQRVSRTIMYFKPPGEICTRSDPENRTTIFDSLPRVSEARWVSIGRLDVGTSGLLLLTTDGGLANKLMHPSSEVPREYVVRVLGEPNDDELDQLRKGVELDDGLASFERLDFTRGEGSNRWYRVMLKEGRNRIVRRLFNHFGYDVSRLMRISYGPIQLPRGLGRGKFRDLTSKEFKALSNAAKKI